MLRNINKYLNFVLHFTKFYLYFFPPGGETGAGVTQVNIPSVKLLPARPGLKAVTPASRVADDAGLGLPARMASAAPMMLATAFLAQRIAQEAMVPPTPAPSLAAAYVSAAPAAFEGLNFRTLA